MNIHNSSIDQQKNIVEASKEKFNIQQKKYIKSGKVVTGVFVSDLHIPDHHVDAWKLTKKILSAINPPRGYVTVQNDWNDLPSWSQRFSDDRPVSEKLNQSEISVIMENEFSMIDELLECVPRLTPIQVLGNHDIRLYKKPRASFPDASELIISNYMSSLWDKGVLQFSRGYNQPHVKLAKDLIWHHGLSAAKSPLSVARNHVSFFMEDGIACNIVHGHTHRPSVVEGRSIGYNGVKVVNAPSLCNNKNVSYLTTGHAPDWGLGISICEFYPNKRRSMIDNIVYYIQDGEMCANWRGDRFTVPVTHDFEEEDNHGVNG